MFLYEIRLKMDKRLHTIDQKGLKLYHWVKKAVWGVEISLESLNIQTQKNNVKFDLKSKYLQISISRTPEEIPVAMIHQIILIPRAFICPLTKVTWRAHT